MYRSTFGKKSQINFESNGRTPQQGEQKYYKLLGYLAKSDGSTSIHWEHNEDQGAWGSEGRIHFIEEDVHFTDSLSHTAGRQGIDSRVNCNDFVKNIVQNHKFVMGGNQNYNDIVDTIPDDFIQDFEEGYKL